MAPLRIRPAIAFVLAVFAQVAALAPFVHRPPPYALAPYMPQSASMITHHDHHDITARGDPCHVWENELVVTASRAPFHGCMVMVAW